MHTSISSSYSSRTNPFNEVTSICSDDDTTASTGPSSTSELTSTTSEGSGDVSFAELGLNEDYFAHPEGSLGMSTTEELEAAIDNCKEEIRQLPEDSRRRKKFVSKLVELRLKFLELKEAPADIEPRSKQVLDHKLRRKKSNTLKHYCDCCNGLIWGMLQSWYRCKDCGFNCHYKCVNLIRRKCIASDITNLPYLLSISPETGLSSQQFNCAECKNPISVYAAGKEEARLCDYSGNYYCSQCHWNDTSVIPARVLHNWDFTPQKISRQSFQILSRLFRRPLLNVQEINSLLFNYVDELRDIRKLRKDILLMKVYFITCKSAMEQKLLRRLSDRQHFVDDFNKYSMDDLIQVKDGALTEYLTILHADYAKHIKLDCLCCQAKGFICEICNSGETLFPFDSSVSTCGKCKAVFHRDCFTCIDTLCPRCERLQKKKVQRETVDYDKMASDPSDNDIDNDYLRSETDSERNRILSTVSGDDTKTNDASNRERVGSKSEAIQIRSTSRTKNYVLLEPSYSDYAALGFAGAGKSKNSLPRQLKHSESNGEFPNSGTVTKEDPKPQVKLLIKNGKVRPSQVTRLQYSNSNSLPDNTKFENNPITRRSQRDEGDFSDLVGVKVQANINGNSNSGKRKEKLAISKSSRDMQKTNSTAAVIQSKKKTIAPPLHLSDSLNKDTEIKSSRKTATHRSELDPFNNNKKKDIAGFAAKQKTATCHPDLGPLNIKSGAKISQKTATHRRDLNPFNLNQNTGTETKNNERSTMHRETNSSENNNPFESKSSDNPFSNDDEYDESKNPFS